jgi:hypothetical protein
LSPESDQDVGIVEFIAENGGGAGIRFRKK